MEVLKAVNLVKHFEAVRALDGVSFRVEGGEIFGLLGPNGAGKTTTINVLTGLARPTSGKVFLEGNEYAFHPKEAQAQMGIVPEESNLYDELDGYENLCFCAAIYGLSKKSRQSRARELLRQFDLEEAAKKPFRSYSKGMKRKLTIAAGIIHGPKILFLDEPTTGIDVMSARQIRSLILRLNREGTTIILTTHYIKEAERLCQRIAFIVRGKIVCSGSLEEIMKDAEHGRIVLLNLESSPGSLLRSFQRQFPQYSFSQVDERCLQVRSGQSIDLVPILGFLTPKGIGVSEARQVRPSLEEVFVRVTGIESEIMRKDREAKKG